MTALGRGEQHGLPALHTAHDILEYDDTVVDDEADRKHETEQRQRVDREIQRRHDDESGDDRDGYRRRRNDGCAKRPDKPVDYEQDQSQREAERLADFLEGCANEHRCIEIDGHIDVVRQCRLQLIDASGYSRIHAQNVRLGLRNDTEAHSGHAVGRRVAADVFRRNLHIRNLCEPDQVVVCTLGQHELPKILDTAEAGIRA